MTMGLSCIRTAKTPSARRSSRRDGSRNACGGPPGAENGYFFANAVRDPSACAIGQQQLDHLRKNTRIRGNDLAAVQVLVFALQIADQSAGLGNQKAARGYVPGVQAHFPEAVVIARRDIGEIERGGAGATHPAVAAIIARIIAT